MKTVNRFADVLNKNLALLSVLVALFALVVPSFWVNLAGSVSLDLSWVPFMGQYFSSLGFVNLLLGVIMFGMGMTLRAEDFALILRRPRDVLVGICSQYVCMAGFGWLVAKLLSLTGVGGPETCAQIAVGLVLLGCVPGGTASNVMTFLAHGDVPLSITITMCTTLLAPVLTPSLTLALAGQWIEVNFWNMFFSIVVVVLLPILLGLGVHAVVGEKLEKIKKLLVLISTVCILLVLGMCVGPNQSSFTQNGLTGGGRHDAGGAAAPCAGPGGRLRHRPCVPLQRGQDPGAVSGGGPAEQRPELAPWPPPPSPAPWRCCPACWLRWSIRWWARWWRICLLPGHQACQGSRWFCGSRGGVRAIPYII